MMHLQTTLPAWQMMCLPTSVLDVTTYCTLYVRSKCKGCILLFQLLATSTQRWLLCAHVVFTSWPRASHAASCS